MKLLSTKKLSESQKELLLNANFSLVEYDAISIEYLKFEIPATIKNAIFTSQNAVRAFIELGLFDGDKKINYGSIYCVGQKTNSILEKNGQKVAFCAKNSSDLGDFIVKNHKNEDFHYFTGNMRRDELPELLNESKIELLEQITYKTELNLVQFAQKFDGILFFSPSGVKSFCLKNTINNAVAFCIGDTTASEAKKYTDFIEIANSTSVESVIAKAHKILHK